MIVGASFLFACGSSAPTDDTGTADLSTHVAALSVNGDGSDEATSSEQSEGQNPEPLMARGCGFSEIVENVVARFDADQSGGLDASEKAALVAEYGDAQSDTPARHPNRGQPTRAAVLLEAYDSDASGSLEASEIEALQADIRARCEERRSKLIEEFDVDGDGALDDAEWEAARVALRERIAERRHARIAEFDSDGNGTLDESERVALRETLSDRRASVEAEFDIDGNGTLDEDERAALEEYFRACVRSDLPMDSRDAAIEHRVRGHLDGLGDDETREADESANDGVEAESGNADEAETQPSESETDSSEGSESAI